MAQKIVLPFSDLVKALLLRPHTGERNFSAKEIFSLHGRLKGKPSSSEQCFSKKSLKSQY